MTSQIYTLFPLFCLPKMFIFFSFPFFLPFSTYDMATTGNSFTACWRKNRYCFYAIFSNFFAKGSLAIFPESFYGRLFSKMFVNEYPISGLFCISEVCILADKKDSLSILKFPLAKSTNLTWNKNMNYTHYFQHLIWPWLT